MHRTAWPRERAAADATTQLDAVLAAIREAGKAAGLQARPLWMPEMSQAMPLDALKQKYPLQPRPYDMQALLGGTGIHLKAEHSFTPERLVGELRPAERALF